MALTVEDGTGLAAADSYNSVAEIDTYNANHGNDPKWNNLTLGQKEEKARLAFQGLDLEYGLRVLGTVKLETQAGLFPRRGIEDPIDGNVYDEDSVPTKWKDAHAELSIEIARGLTLHAAQSDSSRVLREKKKLGPLEKEIEYAGGKAGTSVSDFPRIRKLVARLTTGDVGAVFRG
jgi:hypothetical protein